MAELWHYTCEHSRGGILDAGLLLPACTLAPRAELSAGLWQARLVWLTDRASPLPSAALGLDPNRQTLTTCDRTAYRFRVLDTTGCVWWPEWRRANLPPRGASLLELAEGARPAHWWVSAEPVPVEFDPVVG